MQDVILGKEPKSHNKIPLKKKFNTGYFTNFKAYKPAIILQKRKS